MTKPTCVTLFSGGGLKAIGAQSAGFDLVGAVEMEPAIAAVYRQNLGPNVTVGKVEETDPTPYIGITALLASPVCSRMSIANANRGETDVDIIAAEGVCHWLRVTKPKIFVCENVPQYRASVSCKMIETCLSELGYFYTANNINCADFGVPQSRRRLIIRALLGSMVPALPSPEPHKGWYAAIEDLIPTLPESKFADWQLARLPEDLFGTVIVCSMHGHTFVSTRPAPTVMASDHCSFPRAMLVEGTGHWPSQELNRGPSDKECRMTVRETDAPCPTLKGAGNGFRALLIEGDAAGDRPPTCGTSAAPCFTLKTSSGGRVHRAFIVSDQTDGAGKGCGIRQGDEPSATVRANSGGGTAPRAWLEQGRVVSLTTRALARFQTLPDWYVLPEKKTLASKIIGNGFPCLAAEKILRQLLEAL